MDVLIRIRRFGVRHWFASACLAIGVAASGGAWAVTVRIATAFDPQTMDPHALA